MKYFVFLLGLILFMITDSYAQQKQEPWTISQLMAPETLADKINNSQIVSALIISVGPDDLIKGSVNAGPASEPQNIKQLKALLAKTPKDTEVVIYCGCCPFANCPNIRPAFTLLTESGFKNAKLLNLPQNIKVDWLDKNYPVK
ncbi:rhodanese-like domain-containing protein [Myroides indicus]|uniref:Rhodanese domain-containing protein n=1 Tax=Myroides indicus TaxID=1323422 RepID=A0A4R7ELI8_9FLAO|nr:rhodanese-like domain-containing protein [Myroides indicus]TDS50716.1 hypothetical protein C8P70_1528 [Myroides indicus]